MPSITERLMALIWPEIRQLRSEVEALKAQGAAMALTQEQIQAQFDALTASLAGISQDIQDLKNAVTPGQPMSQENYDKLVAIANAAKALDEANPATPTDPGTGAGGAPVTSSRRRNS